MSEIETLPNAVARFVDALNAADEASLLATLAEDAFVNDAQREFSGMGKIAPFVRRELISPKLTMTPVRTARHRGMIAVDALIDGDFDKAGLPDPLTLSFYFTVEDDLIVTLFVVRNKHVTESPIPLP
jgi:hypothetical protein